MNRLSGDGTQGTHGGRSREGFIPLSHVICPGGWASQKLAALGDNGRKEIVRFAADGGSCLGICGSAGMATEDGIGLLPLRRKGTAERVPSLSSPVRFSLASHAIWKGIETPTFLFGGPHNLMLMRGAASSPGIKRRSRMRSVPTSPYRPGNLQAGLASRRNTGYS